MTKDVFHLGPITRFTYNYRNTTILHLLNNYGNTTILHFSRKRKKKRCQSFLKNQYLQLHLDIYSNK